MERELLRALLQQKQDTDYQAFQYRLIPNAGAVVGVRMPVLHAIADKIVREDWRTWLESTWTESWYEEIMLRALVIARAKMPLAERLTRIQDFVPEIQNWAICDAFCAALHITERDALWTFLQPYLQSETEFAARFGAVMLLQNFITVEDLSRTLSALAKIPATGYHARMGIAWALSVCGVQFPEQTLCFLETAELEDWTYNKTLQKMLESRRLPEALRQAVRVRKRKTHRGAQHSNV